MDRSKVLYPFIKETEDFRKNRKSFSGFPSDEEDIPDMEECERMLSDDHEEDFDYEALSGEELDRLCSQSEMEILEEYGDDEIEAMHQAEIFHKNFEKEEENSYFTKRMNRKAFAEGLVKSSMDLAAKSKSDLKAAETMTKAKAKSMSQSTYDQTKFFVENNMTIAICDGEKILLFEGVLKILERRIVVSEIYAANGKVIDHAVEARFYVSLNVDGAIYTQEVTIDNFDDGKFLAQMSLGEVALEKSANAKKLFAKYAKSLRREKAFETITVFESPGWKKYNSAGEWYYVTPLGVIGPKLFKATVEDKRQFGTDVGYKGLCIASDFLSMREVFKEHKENAIVCQYYLMLSLLKGLLREKNLNPQFLLAIIGETNAKKTTLATLFFKLYDREGGPDIDFTATKVALEEAAAANADAVTIYDDITPPNTRSGELELKGKVESLTRTFGGNLPRKRSKLFCLTNAGVSEFTPVLGQGVITGEVLPVTLKSSRARILKLEFQGTDCDDNILTYHQQHLEFLPSFAMDFISFVSGNQTLLLDSFRQCFDEERVRNICNLKVPRFRDTYAMFAATARTFGSYLRATGVYSESSIQQLISSDLEEIGNIVKLNDIEANQSPDETLIAECILDAKYAQEAGCGCPNPLDVMYEEDGLVCAYPQRVITLLKTYYQKVGRVYPYSTKQELYKFLDSKGLIKSLIEGEEKRHTIKGRDGKRYLKFYKDKLEMLV